MRWRTCFTSDPYVEVSQDTLIRFSSGSPTLSDRTTHVYSGLGPEEHLRKLNIDVVHDMPAVGSHLVRHILAYPSLQTDS